MRGEKYRGRHTRKSPSAVLSVARQAQINSTLAESDLPRPSSVLVFGRGFRPSQDEFREALAGLLLQYGPPLCREHLAGISIQTLRDDALNCGAFFAVVAQRGCSASGGSCGGLVSAGSADGLRYGGSCQPRSIQDVQRRAPGHTRRTDRSGRSRL